MPYKIIKMNEDNRDWLSSKIKKMEKNIYYPLGDDAFKIDHGEDYFRFFERLGDLHYWCVIKGDELIAVAAGILREIDGQKAWYLCDLKVKKNYRGQGIPKKIFLKAFLYNVIHHRVFRAYAVSMNDNNGKTPYKKIKKATCNLLDGSKQLNIYTLTKEQCDDYIKSNNFYLTETNGMKDLILKSTNSKMSLFHLTKNQKLKTLAQIKDDSVIMLSAFKGSELDKGLKNSGAIHNSDATVLTFRMSKIKNIFTDEI